MAAPRLHAERPTARSTEPGRVEPTRIDTSAASVSASRNPRAEILDVQRRVGNKAASAMLAKPTPSSAPTIQRLFGKKAESTVPQISPEIAREIQNQIQQSQTMKEAELFRRQGKEDLALSLLESYWDRGVVMVAGKKYVLKEFKPLLFTPSERRMVKTRRWRMAAAVKHAFDKSVSRGETKPDPQAPTTTESGEGPVSEVLQSVGSVGGGLSTVGGYGAQIGEHFEDPTSGKGMSLMQKELDTTYNNTSDPLHSAPSMQSKSDWAGGILSIITQTFGIVSAVGKIWKAAASTDSEEGSKRKVAEETAGGLSQLSATAGTVLQLTQNISGSTLTTQVFHWVPGLSIFSNGFAAIQSGLALVPRAIQLHATRMEGNKVKDDKARE